MLLRHPGFATVAALVWLLGVELGPGLHIALHGTLDHHHHGAAEQAACSIAGGHEHGEHEHHADKRHGHETHLGHGHHEHHAASPHADGQADADHGHHHTDSGPAHHRHHADAEPAHHRHHAAPAHDHHALPEAHAPSSESRASPATTEPSTERRADAASLRRPGHPPHGAGSLAHRDDVPLDPPLALPPVLSAPWRPLTATPPSRLVVDDRTPDTLRARGPPRRPSADALPRLG